MRELETKRETIVDCESEVSQTEMNDEKKKLPHRSTGDGVTMSTNANGNGEQGRRWPLVELVETKWD